jgi:hypothetical protein
MSDRRPYVPIPQKVFLTLGEAAAYAGLSKQDILAAANALDPLPHFKSGKVYKIQRSAIEPYFARKRVSCD